MPATSAAERQKLLLQQEIAKLSGAISRQTTQAPTANARHASSYHPYRGSSRGRGGYGSYSSSQGYGSRGGYAASSRGRGATSSGRGRNGHSLDLRGNNSLVNAVMPSGSAIAGPSSSHAATSVVDTSSNKSKATADREEGEMSPSPPPAAALPSTSSSTSAGPSVKGKEKAQDSQNWVKTSSRGNMSLMTAEKRKELASRPKPAKIRKSRIPPSIQVLSSTTDTTGQRVVIDGVIFQFEPGGTKLTRIGDVNPVAPGSGPLAASPNSTPTRRKLSYGGKQFRRTSKGNLITGRGQAKERKFCRYYTRTGLCSRALTCPYLHSPAHRSICPAFLRSTCPHTAETCPLSHTPSAHNTPSCLHFQATSFCKKGEACPYPHVKTAKDAPVCMAFAKEGWCDKEAGTCGEVHCWECPDFRAKGVCGKGGKCGLRHVLRAGTGAIGGVALGEGKEKDEVAVYKDVSGEPLANTEKSSVGSERAAQVSRGNFDDGSTFIGLPALDDDEEQDHGFPMPLAEGDADDDGLGDEEVSGEDEPMGSGEDGDAGSVSGGQSESESESGSGSESEEEQEKEEDDEEEEEQEMIEGYADVNMEAETGLAGASRSARRASSGSDEDEDDDEEQDEDDVLDIVQ